MEPTSPGVEQTAERLQDALGALREAIGREREAATSMEDAYVLDTLLDDAEAIAAAYRGFVQSLHARQGPTRIPGGEDAYAALRAAAARIEPARSPLDLRPARPRER